MPELYPDMTSPEGYLPLIFMALMGLAILAYVILDGYDLGVGILLKLAGQDEKDIMIASIGPFWDANETWLVLGVGLLLVAFPLAHGAILGALYLPVTLMLLGLTLRGVAFDFRVKARVEHKENWNRVFWVGSLLAALAQGYMLGMLVVGFETTALTGLFAIFIGLCLALSYALLGACWLIAKTEGSLQRKAVRWATGCLGFTALGLAAVSIATPMISERVFDRWFTLGNFVAVWPIPLMTVVLLGLTWRALRRLPVRLEQSNEYGVWIPFAASVGLFMLAFHGLAYSLFPYLIIDELTIWDAAAAPASLKFILVGALLVLPVIVAYTVFAYRVFRGKATPLEYY